MVLLLGSICVCMGPAASAQARPSSADRDTVELRSSHSFLVLSENDNWANGGDQRYTQGLELAYSFSRDGVRSLRSGFARWTGFLLMAPRKDVEFDDRIVIGQTMYTPSDIRRTDEQLNDQPFGGWLYLGYARQSRSAVSFRQLEWRVGVTGPESKAEKVQVWFHRLAGYQRPLGWPHQLSGGFAPSLSYIERHLVGGARTVTTEPWARADAFTELHAAIGPVFDFGEVGCVLRVGHGIGAPWDYSRIDQTLMMLQKTTTRQPPQRFAVFAFGGAYGRGVLYDYFIDGPLFHGRDDQINKLPWTGRIEGGGVLRYSPIQASYRYVDQGPEFRPGAASHRFGTISLTIACECP